MKHFYGLMDFKRVFKEAQAFHVHAIKHGDEKTKSELMEHHIKGGNFDVLVQRSSNTNNKQKR